MKLTHVIMPLLQRFPMKERKFKKYLEIFLILFKYSQSKLIHGLAPFTCLTSSPITLSIYHSTPLSPRVCMHQVCTCLIALHLLFLYLGNFLSKQLAIHSHTSSSMSLFNSQLHYKAFSGHLIKNVKITFSLLNLLLPRILYNIL